MRVTEKEKQVILRAIKSRDMDARVFLFGSRVEDALKGGDLDLFVISDILGFSDKIDILIKIKEQIGDQKIDLLLRTPAEASNDPFVQSQMDHATELK